MPVLDLTCPSSTFMNEMVYCNVSIQPNNYISNYYSFLVDYGDGSSNTLFNLFAYGKKTFIFWFASYLTLSYVIANV
jgi:hypothetical protein